MQPLLPQIARPPEQPKATEAKDVLEVLLGDDRGDDLGEMAGKGGRDAERGSGTGSIGKSLAT